MKTEHGKCALSEPRITGLLLIGSNDEVFYTKTESGKACPFTIITHEKPKQEPEKKSKVAKMILNRIKELESTAEEYYQELGNPEEGAIFDTKADELKELLTYLK